MPGAGTVVVILGNAVRRMRAAPYERPGEGQARDGLPSVERWGHTRELRAARPSLLDAPGHGARRSRKPAIGQALPDGWLVQSPMATTAYAGPPDGADDTVEAYSVPSAPIDGEPNARDGSNVHALDAVGVKGLQSRAVRGHLGAPARAGSTTMPLADVPT